MASLMFMLSRSLGSTFQTFESSACFWLDVQNIWSPQRCWLVSSPACFRNQQPVAFSLLTFPSCWTWQIRVHMFLHGSILTLIDFECGRPLVEELGWSRRRRVAVLFWPSKPGTIHGVQQYSWLLNSWWVANQRTSGLLLTGKPVANQKTSC